jgi:hypothetical protein
MAVSRGPKAAAVPGSQSARALVWFWPPRPQRCFCQASFSGPVGQAQAARNHTQLAAGPGCGHQHSLLIPGLVRQAIMHSSKRGAGCAQRQWPVTGHGAASAASAEREPPAWRAWHLVQDAAPAGLCSRRERARSAPAAGVLGARATAPRPAAAAASQAPHPAPTSCASCASCPPCLPCSSCALCGGSHPHRPPRGAWRASPRAQEWAQPHQAAARCGTF